MGNINKKCRVCGTETETCFNINLKATPICECCADSIFLQQATWYSQERIKKEEKEPPRSFPLRDVKPPKKII